MNHQHTIRVYYEDVDLAGIVYYANYLKFIERGRSEWVRSLRIDQVALQAAQGIVFAVRRVEADYLSPARFDDVICVHTRLQSISGARILLDQQVLCVGRVIFAAKVVLVCLGREGRTRRIPAEIRARLAPG